MHGIFQNEKAHAAAPPERLSAFAENASVLVESQMFKAADKERKTFINIGISIILLAAAVILLYFLFAHNHWSGLAALLGILIYVTAIPAGLIVIALLASLPSTLKKAGIARRARIGFAADLYARA